MGRHSFGQDWLLGGNFSHHVLLCVSLMISLRKTTNIVYGRWGHGSGYLDSAAIATAAKLFPSERGSVVGLLKSLYGLASSLVVTAVAPLVGQLTFIGVLALVAVSLPALAMGGLEQRPSTNLNAAIEAGRIAGFAKRIVALATALVLVAVVKVARPWHNLAADICVSIGVALGLAAATTPRLMVKSAAERPLMRVSYVSAAGSRDATPGDAVRSLELWLLSGCVLPVAGCGLMTINNLGQIISSRGAGVATQDVGVALVSVANCLGRLSAGVASDGLANRGLPRPLLLCLSAAIACVAMLVLYASGTSITFCLIGVVLAGFSYGMLWTLMPTLIADFFGFRRLASNYMLCLPSVILASLIFSTLLASMVYARHASNSDDDDDEDKCLGASCFGTTFLVTAACCAVASISAAGLTFKTRVLYYRKAAPLVTSEDGVDNPLTAS